MPRLLAWGNNCARALDPTSSDTIIYEPRDITDAVGCDGVRWHEWTCTLGQSSGTGKSRAWGTDPLVPEGNVGDIVISERVTKILGVERPIAQFLEGTIHLWEGATSARWDDAALTEIGQCVAWKANDGLYLFESLKDLMKGQSAQQVNHPLIPNTSAVKLFATETRMFVLVCGGLHTLLEVVTDRGGRPCPTHLKPISGLEGLGIASVVTGSANRIGVVTDAGQAFIIPARSQELEELDVDDDIRLMGLGSKHEVLVGEEDVWVRGENEFGQTSVQAAEVFTPLRVDPSQVLAIHCGRWSTILTMQS